MKTAQVQFNTAMVRNRHRDEDAPITSSYAASVNYALGVSLIVVMTFAFAHVVGGIISRDLYGCIDQSISLAGTDELGSPHVCL